MQNPCIEKIIIKASVLYQFHLYLRWLKFNPLSPIISKEEYSHLLLHPNFVKLHYHQTLTSSSAHSHAGYQTSFNQLVWIMSHNFSVFTSAWFTLVSIHYQIFGPVLYENVQTVRKLHFDIGSILIDRSK